MRVCDVYMRVFDMYMRACDVCMSAWDVYISACYIYMRACSACTSCMWVLQPHLCTLIHECMLFSLMLYAMMKGAITRARCSEACSESARASP